MEVVMVEEIPIKVKLKPLRKVGKGCMMVNLNQMVEMPVVVLMLVLYEIIHPRAVDLPKDLHQHQTMLRRMLPPVQRMLESLVQTLEVVEVVDFTLMDDSVDPWRLLMFERSDIAMIKSLRAWSGCRVVSNWFCFDSS